MRQATREGRKGLKGGWRDASQMRPLKRDARDGMMAR